MFIFEKREARCHMPCGIPQLCLKHKENQRHQPNFIPVLPTFMLLMSSGLLGASCVVRQLRAA